MLTRSLSRLAVARTSLRQARFRGGITSHHAWRTTRPATAVASVAQYHSSHGEYERPSSHANNAWLYGAAASMAFTFFSGLHERAQADEVPPFVPAQDALPSELMPCTLESYVPLKSIILLVGPRNTPKMEVVNAMMSSARTLGSSPTLYISAADVVVNRFLHHCTMESLLCKALQKLLSSTEEDNAKPVVVIDDLDLIVSEDGAPDAVNVLRYLVANVQSQRISACIITTPSSTTLERLPKDVRRAVTVVPVGFIPLSSGVSLVKELEKRSGFTLDEATRTEIIDKVGTDAPTIERCIARMQGGASSSDAIEAELQLTRFALRNALLDDDCGLLLWYVLQELLSSSNAKEDESGLAFVEFEKMAMHDKFKRRCMTRWDTKTKTLRQHLSDVINKFDDILYGHALGHHDIQSIGAQRQISACSRAIQTIAKEMITSDEMRKAMHDIERNWA